MSILYLCDGKNPYCKCKEACGVNHSDAEDVCFHTTNPDYAINGSLKQSPEECNADNTEERPWFVKDESGYYWEGFIGYGKLNLINKRSE